MAGGEGTRLQPLSLGRPKPMIPLFGRPVLEHMIRLLKEHQITDICITLCHHHQGIMDHFGDGRALGVRLTYFVEEEPLGMAGSVKNCMNYLGEEDFLVMGGGCVCDLDLSRVIQCHKESGAEATLVLYRHKNPLDYSLVVTGEDGRVERFVDRPGWGQVVTDQISTGIYLLSPRAMERVPLNGGWEFEQDLFPAMVKDGAALLGCQLRGCWHNIVDSQTYLHCVCDCLDGKMKLEMGLPHQRDGIWTAQPIPPEVTLSPPCWIGADVKLEAGANIGPYVVLERGVEIGRQTVVHHSVLMEGAVVGEQVSLNGSILCDSAAVRKGAVLNQGVVLGENALVEEQVVLLERVHLWPGQCAPAGCRLRHSVTSGCQKGVLRFGDSGVIQGVLGEDLGPEALVLLGSVLGEEGKTGVGCSNTPGARMLTQAAIAGITAAGGEAVAHPLDSPSQGADAGVMLNLPVSLFVQEHEGVIYLHLFDDHGLPLRREREHKLEEALRQDEVHQVRSGRVGQMTVGDLSAQQWARWVVQQASLGRPALRKITVAVGKDCPEDRAIRAALSALGCELEENWRPGIIAFHAGKGGFSLTAQDERGAVVDAGQVLALLVLIEMENGSGRAGVPAGASAAVELVAAGYGGTVLRLGRDGEQARTLYAAQPWLRQAPAAAVRICARMGASGQKLERLVAKTPHFSTWRREVPLHTDRGRVMEALAQRQGQRTQGEGLRIRSGGGWVYVSPMVRRASLRIVAEGPDLELAAELCDFYAAKTVELDQDIFKQDRKRDKK